MIHTCILYRHTVPPYSITIQYHHTVSPYSITIQYHHTVSPRSITIQRHHTVSLYSIAIQYHHTVSPYSITIQYRHTVSPYSITIQYNRIEWPMTTFHQCWRKVHSSIKWNNSMSKRFLLVVSLLFPGGKVGWLAGTAAGCSVLPVHHGMSQCVVRGRYNNDCTLGRHITCANAAGRSARSLVDVPIVAWGSFNWSCLVLSCLVLPCLALSCLGSPF